MSAMEERVRELFAESAKTRAEFFTPEAAAMTAKMADAILGCLKKGGKLLICGNGGSASDSAHFAGEMTGRFMKERPAISAVALNTDMASITAIANDYGYEKVFSRQIEGLARPEDALFVLSTSGNSANLLEAVKKAKEKKLKTFGLLGRDGGKLKGMLDLSLTAPAGSSPRIQEIHITVIHVLCDLIESGLQP